MSRDNPRAVHLKDYRVPAFLIDKVDLHFALDDTETRVRSRLKIRRNPASEDWQAPLQLDGDPTLKLCRLSIDGRELEAGDYRLEPDRLEVPGAFTEPFELGCETLINPSDNTALEGLYQSNGMFCTQCEAEGFRRITYYLDRPDVMAVFTTTLEADAERFPVLLANGNPLGEGREGGRHWVRWEDPYPKPSYLFALVAGDLQRVDDSFVTASGREVALRLFVEARNLDKCDHALASLKRAMRWDEENYGREYDLDIFMVVAVDHFNMGAMENKGLNIFNSACVLANPATTTDAGFERIEAIVAHEYFHNWSGNRVTCRDWFQLSLKEGFTVFRDSQYSADRGSPVVKRIEDVSLLRSQQFAEDAGPMAHPVRPPSYMEISNFYTLTVYEKGCEVVRMLHTLLGAECFRRGTDLYFERHDGQAVTTDDFVACMEAVSGRDLTQFKHWYSQAGTPRVAARDDFDATEGCYRLTLSQSCPPTPECADKAPFLIPVRVGLLDAQGRDLLPEGSRVLELGEREQTFVFDGLAERPLPSLLRDFSAPVILDYAYRRDDRVFLMTQDSDGFNRWDAGQQLAVEIIAEGVAAWQAGAEFQVDERFLSAMEALVAERSSDPAMVARMLLLPSEAYLAQRLEPVDMAAIHGVRAQLRRLLAERFQGLFMDAYRHNQAESGYEFSPEAVGRRSLKNRALGYLMALDRPQDRILAEEQFLQADNMTDRLAALNLLAESEDAELRARVLDRFHADWHQDPLVLNQWFSVQAAADLDDSLERVKALAEHPDFDAGNPNRVRALVGVFCNQNLAHFHRADGAGYRFLADWVLYLDPRNPQIASRLLGPLTRWQRHLEPQRQLMKAELERIKSSGELSADSFEVVTKTLV